VLVDNCNGISLSAVTAGLGMYSTGYGACGSQTTYTTREDIGVNIQTSTNILKNLTVPGTVTGLDNGSITFGPGLHYSLYAHESNVSGAPGAVLKTDNLGLLVQNGQVTGGSSGGGLAINGNGFGTDAAVGQIGAGETSDTGTFTARATTAAIMQFVDGITYFYNDSGLTAGSTYSPTNTFRIDKTGAGFFSSRGQHLKTSAAGNDLVGTIAVSGATSASYTFATAFVNAPVCTLTPVASPGVFWWVTTSTTAVTANLASSGTVTFNYTCVGNPN
jgi:hypothetical protein